jgi:hypothetical protein
VPEAILSHGGSCVVGPLGTFVASPVWDKQEIVYADLSMDDLVESRVKASFPPGVDKNFSLIAGVDGFRSCRKLLETRYLVCTSISIGKNRC